MPASPWGVVATTTVKEMYYGGGMATNNLAQFLAHASPPPLVMYVTDFLAKWAASSKLVGRGRNKVTPSINTNLPLPPTRA
ncbi:hypothetical protein NQ176_g6789 [Zarea fungicola]|uniref:Uncharacterized protein n=1 Tax=Zarea fungicola TaxID=93591 RepID=A0ACC1N218_9HYPO|nr:hypothetical protein NQ176_g6789 [Lecanicillium fungicola]